MNHYSFSSGKRVIESIHNRPQPHMRLHSNKPINYVAIMSEFKEAIASAEEEGYEMTGYVTTLFFYKKPKVRGSYNGY